MTSLTLALRSLRFHARSHLGTLLGATVSSAALVGALAVGYSVRASLWDMALARLGATQLALASGDHFFRSELASDLQQPVAAPVVAVLLLQGTAAVSDGSARANRVQVLGIDRKFWALGLQAASFQSPGPDEVVLNQALAGQLKTKVGDTILLRVEKPARLSREAPISPQEDFALALRVTVRAIAPDKELGRFSLQASQVPPFNAFVSSEWLSQRLQIPGRANVLLVGPGANSSAERASAALRESWQLADAQLELRSLEGTNGLELRTSRVFLEPPAAAAATNASPAARSILTYFVNELRVGDHVTPYSMVTAMGVPVVPADLPDDQILINSWLADDLQAKAGDVLELSYFVIGASRKLESRTNQFTVRAVLPLSGAAADRSLMPDFPGLEHAESTRDWDNSLPIKLEKIRPKDEAYWKQFRGTPKAFVTMAAGQKMWANRFGALTAVRFPSGQEQSLGQTILRALDPASLGLGFQPVRQQALAATDQAQDFGQLFLGFSFFLIVAALLLMVLLFQFALEQRATEVGTLLALGFTPKRVRRLLLWEGVGLATVGGVLGMLAGIAYAKAMLYGLSTVWRNAVQTSALQYHTDLFTLALGAAIAILVALLTIWFALRRQARRPARELLAEGAAENQYREPGKRGIGIWIGWLASAFAMLTIGAAGLEQQRVGAEVFFLAGTLLLISSLGFADAFLAALGSGETATQLSLTNLSVRNVARRRRRSLATIGLLACGSFLIASIGVFKLDAGANATQRSSGTGGFAWIGETTLPIVQDLNSVEGRQFFGLGDQDLPGVQFVPFRVRDGEDASCLNLNRAQRPRVLGVRAELLNHRGSFTFSQVAKGLSGKNPWLLLNQAQADGSVPAIGDATSVEWALGKKIGDTISYSDDRGREFKLRLVAAVADSVLQGSLIICEQDFLNRFPSESGYRFFLIDAPFSGSAPRPQIAATLSRATQDYGMELTPAARRLAEFDAVQNTYLNTFQVLGGLGLLLGSIGLGVLVLRNVLERRGELGLFLAVGFRPRALKWMVLSEHGALLSLGLMLGIFAAFVAVLPTLFAPGARLPALSLSLTLGGIFASGALWTWLATQVALRGRLLDALRDE